MGNSHPSPAGPPGCVMNSKAESFPMAFRTVGALKFRFKGNRIIRC